MADEQQPPVRWRVEVEGSWTIRRTVEVMAGTIEEAAASAEQAVQLGMVVNPPDYLRNGVAVAEAVQARELDDA